MDFRAPPHVIFGRGIIGNINMDGKGVLVTGENTWKGIRDFLPFELPLLFFRRSSATGEPLERDVEKLTSDLREMNPDFIVAVGGGSVIDTVKIARAMLDGASWKDVYDGKIRRSEITLVSVETTSGTGTGVSAAAVVIDEDGLKRGIVNPNLMSDLAVYDSNLVMSMPMRVAIYSGMDALTHAIEAYTSNVRNVVSDTLALKAIELIYRNLENSVYGDEEAREKVHYGNMLAGLGFTNSRLGLCHAAAHKIGGRYGIEHGKVNAILLPYVIRVNESHAPFKDVAKVMGVDDVAEAVVELNEKFGIPTRIPLENIDSLADEILEDKLMAYNPRRMEKEDVVRFLEAVRSGDLNEI